MTVDVNPLLLWLEPLQDSWIHPQRKSTQVDFFLKQEIWYSLKPFKQKHMPK